MLSPSIDDIEYLRRLGVGLTFTKPLPLSEVDQFLRACSTLIGKTPKELVITSGNGRGIRFGVRAHPCPHDRDECEVCDDTPPRLGTEAMSAHTRSSSPASAESATVRDFVLAQPGLAHVTIDTDRELLRTLIENIGDNRTEKPRWAHVKDALGHGSGVSQSICRALGLDPDEQVGALACAECGAPEVLCECDDGLDELDEACDQCGWVNCECETEPDGLSPAEKL